MYVYNISNNLYNIMYKDIYIYMTDLCMYMLLYVALIDHLLVYYQEFPITI